MKAKPVSIRSNNGGWMRRFLNSVGFLSRFSNQDSVEGYKMNPSPVLELGRVNGKLVLMSRNQTMRMLIQEPQASRQSLLSFRQKTGH
jgi:hypothetical protein